MSDFSPTTVAADPLLALLDRIEQIEAEKSQIASQIRGLCARTGVSCFRVTMTVRRDEERHVTVFARDGITAEKKAVEIAESWHGVVEAAADDVVKVDD